MKLLFVCPDWFPFSAGLAQTTMEMVQYLESQGHEVKLVVAKDPKVDSRGLTLVKIPYLFRLLGRNPIPAPILYWRKLKKYIEWSDSVVLVSYMYEMNSRIVLWKKLGLYDKPLIHLYMGSLEREGAKFLSTLTRSAKQLWDHTLGKIMFTQVDLTISNSKPTLNYIYRLYGVSKKKLSYIPTAIDVKSYTTSKVNNKRIIFIGRLIENKGVHHFKTLLEVIPKDWTFTVVGDGPLHDQVQELAKQYSQVEFLGKVSHDTVKEYLGKSDINILPTYAEGSPRAVIEACASGVPSVSFAVGDVETIVEKPYAIHNFNLEEMKKQLETLIKDQKLRQQVGKKAQNFIRKHQDHHVVFKQLENEIRSKIQ